MRLRALRRYAGHLWAIRATGARRILTDPILEGALCRYLQLAIECVLDIGEIIIAGEGWPRPPTNREVVLELGRRGVLPAGFSRKLSGAAGLRNILVHDYVELDLKLVVRHLDLLGDFDRFARLIASYLKRRRRG